MEDKFLWNESWHTVKIMQWLLRDIEYLWLKTQLSSVLTGWFLGTHLVYFNFKKEWDYSKTFPLDL